MTWDFAHEPFGGLRSAQPTLPCIMDIPAYCEQLARQARAASRTLAAVNGEQKNRWLLAAARALEERTPEILDANAKDVARAPEFQLSAAMVDRLRLTPDRIRAMAEGLRQI